MFGEKLKEIIESKYDNLSKFSETCEISKGHLNDILKGRILPKDTTMKVFLKNLQPLTKEDEKMLLREWAFDKSDGILREDFKELETQNKNMLEVLKTVKKEKDLLEEIAMLKDYEAFYNIFFKDLSSEETKIVLNSMVRELKAMSVGNPKVNLLKEKFEKLEEIIDKI